LPIDDLFDGSVQLFGGQAASRDGHGQRRLRQALADRGTGQGHGLDIGDQRLDR